MRRVIDTLLALVGIALLAPLILLISVCVLIAPGRPILFRQWRAGQNGMPFQLVKFRSMRDTRDPRGQLLPDEERVTTIGRLLRRRSGERRVGKEWGSMGRSRWAPLH